MPMKRNRTTAILGALFALATFAPISPAVADESCEACCASTSIQQASLEQVRAIATGKTKGVIIDSRSSYAFKQGHIPKAISLPVDDMTASRLPKDKGTLLVFYCGASACGLSAEAAQKAVQLGYKKVAVYKGGWQGWNQTASR